MEINALSRGSCLKKTCLSSQMEHRLKLCLTPFFFFKQKTAYEIGLGIPAEPLFRSFRVGIKSNISTNRNNLISGVDRCIHLNAMKKTTITSINRQTIKI